LDNLASAATTLNKKAISSQEILLIVIGNIIPLIGVLFFNWEIGHIITLYWIENIILGLWNIPRILFAGEDTNRFKNLPITIFFVVHYGIFCFVHGIFIVGLVTYSQIESFDNIAGAEILSTVSSFASVTFTIGVISMFISIGWDVVKNYILNEEHKKWKASKAMSYPYAHIVVVHVAIFAGAFGAVLLGAPLALLIALIIGKTLIEFRMKQNKEIKKTLIRY